jgi:dihydrofolate reductase
MKEMIVAHGSNYEIGANNQLLWHFSEDLMYFKKLTIHKNVIQGYNTYKSIGKPLPNRNNIILTRKNIEIDNCIVCNSIDDINLDSYIVIGGDQVYKQFIDRIDILYVTLIPCYYPTADSFFLSDYAKKFNLISREISSSGLEYLIYKK